MAKVYPRVLGGLCIGLALCGNASALDKVIIGLSNPVGIWASGILFGKQLGFFEEEGIDVQLVSFSGGGVLVPQVANKSVQFGLIDPSIPMVSYAKGSPYPVRHVYNMLRTNVTGFFVPADSAVQQISDFKGKTIGIMSVATGVNIMARAAFKSSGVDWDKDVKKVPTGMGPPAWRQLEGGHVATLNTTYLEGVRMAMGGVKVRRIDYPQNLQGIYSMGLLTNADMLKQNPKLIESMGRALSKSTIACEAAPVACLRANWVINPVSRPTPDKEKQWIDDSLPVLKVSLTSAVEFPGGKREWGAFVPGALDAYKAALKDSGTVPKDADIPDDAIFTNQFVKQFNNFSTPAVLERAAKAEREAAR